jgi:hypothetical protein
MRRLQTDGMRTVLRRVLPERDAIDHPADAARLAEFIYPQIEQAADVAPRKPNSSSLRAMRYQRHTATSPGSNWRSRDSTWFLANWTLLAQLLCCLLRPNPAIGSDLTRWPTLSYRIWSWV